MIAVRTKVSEIATHLDDSHAAILATVQPRRYRTVTRRVARSLQ
jgi:hypothetical protein